MTSAAGSVLPSRRRVVVWGNCQAAPLADLISPALRLIGGEVMSVPPVFEVVEDDLATIRRALAQAAALISQPVRDEYATAGCGTRQLAALLPPDARVVRFPVAFDTSAFPYQVNAHGADGARVSAPVTDYHDLRMIVAAERRWSVEQTVDRWPSPSPDAVRDNAAGSLRELRRRERDLDVEVSDLLGPDAMFTLSHPTNDLLAAEARRILAALGLPEDAVTVPDREYLGERRAPVEDVVAEALGWPQPVDRDTWVVRGEPVDPHELAATQLAFYAERPDVVADSRTRHAERRALMGL
ncbi:MAG: WcbI family polysaccharide biosynthesis putative acetyltransferase [Propionibacteriaceae bacterium]